MAVDGCVTPPRDTRSHDNSKRPSGPRRHPAVGIVGPAQAPLPDARELWITFQVSSNLESSTVTRDFLRYLRGEGFNTHQGRRGAHGAGAGCLVRTESSPRPHEGMSVLDRGLA